MFNEDDIVFRYTRDDAIQDGVLVDVSNPAKEAGFSIPLVGARQGIQRTVAHMRGQRTDDAKRRFTRRHMGSTDSIRLKQSFQRAREN